MRTVGWITTVVRSKWVGLVAGLVLSALIQFAACRFGK